ncbi:hypothetical protein [Actinomadura madurae]|uniref:hypothetical protein n=1 Tax=Actinomadura madurae TaxID=1993 RepID=UPI0020D21324|nr:hypothetical protein [Actinomadura madurae]MCP9951916.1 hypothetical protein [Actinomadura madurae]MCQ0017352.1 hypothetical protein [Actinomadura madurae]
MRQADDTEAAEAAQWLARHGLADAEPSPLLVTRLAVRRRARAVDSILLAAFLLGAALTHALALPVDVLPSWLPLLVLTALVAGLLVAQRQLGRWVRRVDRQAGARLPRRVAHPVALSWPEVLGGRMPSSRPPPSPARCCSRSACCRSRTPPCGTVRSSC